MSFTSSPLPPLADATTLTAPADENEHYRWPVHVYACRTLTGAVLLDLQCNRYFALDDPDATAIADLIEGKSCLPAIHVHDEVRSAERRDAVIAVLCNARLLQRSIAGTRYFLPSAIDLRGPLLSIEERITAQASLRAHHLAHFAAQCARSRHALKSSSLYEIACAVRCAKATAIAPDATSLSRVATLVAVFRRLRPYTFTAYDQCLFHALALVRFLATYGVAASWVVGVRLHPWAAHSWVQHGELLLDATPEMVRAYTPIVAV